MTDSVLAADGPSEIARSFDGQAKNATLSQALKRDPLVQFVFLSLLLLGGDRIAINTGGITLRVVFPIMMTAWGFLYLNFEKEITFNKVLCVLFFLFATAGALSVVKSYAPGKSVGYTIWVLFDFFVLISLFYNFAKNYSAKLTLSIWLFVFRIHTALIVLSTIWGLATHTLNRPRLWFYEPSYLAVFMSAYFGSSLYLLLSKGRKYWLDFALSVLALLIITSATGIFGVLFAIALNFVVARQRLKLLLGSALLMTLFFGILYYAFRNTGYFFLVASFLSEQNTLHLILQRGGDRYVRALIGWDAFLKNPWTGIGIGGDEAYMHITPYPEAAWEYVHPWTDPRQGEPFCNVIVEILGTTGILGFIPFSGILLYAAWSMIAWGKRHAPPPEAVAFLVGFFSTFLAMQLDGTVLRYYLWSPLGLGLGIIAQMQDAKARRAAEVGSLVPSPAPL